MDVVSFYMSEKIVYYERHFQGYICLSVNRSNVFANIKHECLSCCKEDLQAIVMSLSNSAKAPRKRCT